MQGSGPRSRVRGARAHTLRALHGRPQSRRDVWRAMFEHDVVRTDREPVPYLPGKRRGILGPLTERIQKNMRVQVIGSLTKRLPAQLGAAS